MPDPTTPEGRAEVKARAERAQAARNDIYRCEFRGWIPAKASYRSIAASQADVPALLDALDEAEFEIERQRGDLVIARRHGTAQYRRAEKAEAQLAEAQDTIRGYESAVEGLATTIGEQRQQLSAIRDYAQELHALADTTRDAGGDYLAHTYRGIATALDRKIGDKP